MFNFRKSLSWHTRERSEPEINLIPFIDVLLVILIFLMLTTTYSKFTQLELELPTADTEKLQDRPRELIISIAADGSYALEGKGQGQGQSLTQNGVADLATALEKQSAALAGEKTVLVISADAHAPHQSVISVMEAARRAGLAQLTFATQQSGSEAP